MTIEQETILIVDDEEIARQVIQRKLSNEGYRCIEASDADQALDQMKMNPIELAILDIKMPGKSGIELLSEIKEYYPDTAVIMVTAVNDMDIALQCMRQGAFDYITKPLNFEELVLTVEKALEMRRLRLVESGEKYRTIFESANDVLILIDRKGKILEVNDKLKEIGGYDREELLGKNIQSLTKLMTKKSLAIVLKNFAKRVVGFNVPPYEVEMLTKSGKLLNIEINAVAMRREGKIVGDLAILRDVTERRQAEETLRESEERWRSLVTSLPNIVMLVDRDNIIQFINNTVPGMKVQDVIGKSIYDYIQPDHHDVVRKAMNGVFKTGKPGYYEIQGTGSDGHISWYETRIGPIVHDGHVVAVIQITLDITERKQAEKVLQESEERYRSLIEGAHDMIQSVRPDGSFIFANPAWLQTLGYTEKELPNLNMFNIIHPESQTHCQEMFARVMDGESVQNISTTFIAKDGRKILVEGNAAPRYLGDSIIATQGIFRDVTESKQAEKVLQESEERYRSVIDGAHDMIQSVRPDGSFVFANPAWLQTLGYSIKDLPYLTIYDIIHPESRAYCQEMFTRVMGGESVQNVSATFIAKDGRKILVEGNATPRCLGDSTIVTQGIFRDVTERKRAEEQIKRLYEQVKEFNIELEGKIKERTRELEAAVKDAEAANQAKSEFLSNMSHELRTPLTAIIGFSQVLAEQYFGELNEKQTEYVNDILESGEHLLSLINDILDLAKIEAGKDELELSRFNVKELLESSLVMIKEKALKHSINLETQITSELDHLIITADRRKVKQIVFNLLSNAAKFTPDDGTITLGARREGSELIISVADTGIGIGSEDQKKIFGEFYQVQSGLTDKTPGTGLGLPLSKRMVEMHGGRIWVESEGEDKGSIFTFSLPIREASQETETVSVVVKNI
jgi:PAS domain S-box-containing protein